MSVFEPGTMRMKGLTEKERQEMVERGEKAMREGKIWPVGHTKPKEPKPA